MLAIVHGESDYSLTFDKQAISDGPLARGQFCIIEMKLGCTLG